MGILSWIVFGLVAGGLAKLIMPGRDPKGCIVTIALGVGGAVVGGLIGTQLGWGDVTGFNPKSFGLAIGGALLLLAIYQMMNNNQRKP